jgi:hypothetical protein
MQLIKSLIIHYFIKKPKTEALKKKVESMKADYLDSFSVKPIECNEFASQNMFTLWCFGW